MASATTMPAYLLPTVAPVHPPHLEGDPTLATEILPGPPPLVSVQQSIQKRDNKKPGFAPPSYLPSNDPGTTYAGPFGNALGVAGNGTTLAGGESTPTDGPRPKRARIDKGRIQRAQRKGLAAQGTSSASAFNLMSPLVQPQPVFDSDQDPATLVEEEMPVLSSRASSLGNGSGIGETSTGRQRASKKRDKGKEKETNGTGVGIKVKEEPRVISLLADDEQPLSQANEDHCSSCRSFGALVYCDGCPRAFHFGCLNPPMNPSDLPGGDSRWFCPSCVVRKNPPPKPRKSMFSPMIQILESSIPTEYQLPEDIRTFFKDVATAPNGVYVDGSEIKQARLNRFGQIDERDIHKLKDRNGDPVLCFRCGRSALPDGMLAQGSASTSSTRQTRRSTAAQSSRSEEAGGIISCDYCDLHWHVDCVTPPMASLPPLNKKWMCPNHADQVTGLTLRIPRQNAPPIEVTKPKQFNNGVIDIIRPVSSGDIQKVIAEEVQINGRRYRVPERIIQLDFWHKVGRPVEEEEKEKSPDTVVISSRASSPLTSLSSLEDTEDRIASLSTMLPEEPLDDRAAAEILYGLHSFPPFIAKPGPSRRMVTIGTQTDSSLAHSIFAPVLPKASSHKPTLAPRKAAPAPKKKVTKALAAESAAKSAPVAKRARPTPPVGPSTRELRSSRRRAGDTNGFVVKKEEVDVLPDLGSSISTARPSATTSGSSISAPLEPAKRGRKRKVPLPEDDYVPAGEQSKSSTPVAEREKKKLPRTPRRGGSGQEGGAAGATTQVNGSNATPTLKIRLPRLLSISGTPQVSPAKQAD